MTPLTEQEKIELLATKVMGWEKRNNENSFWFIIGNTGIAGLTLYSYDREKLPRYYWNPFTDWNHTHMVLDKVMTDEELANNLLGMIRRDINVMIFGATKQELMDAVLSLITL